MREKRKAGLLLACVLLILAGCGKEKPRLLLEEETQAEEQEAEEWEEEGAEETEPEKEEVLIVYVCGAVNAPGVYELEPGARVCRAIEAAGGLTGEADPSRINQAAPLSDGEQITVPETGEEVPVPEGSSDSGKVNINTAGKEQLMQLTGIGETRAEAILSYREQQGPFRTVEDLMKVEGIKEKTWEKIKEDITV